MGLTVPPSGYIPMLVEWLARKPPYFPLTFQGKSSHANTQLCGMPCGSSINTSRRVLFKILLVNLEEELKVLKTGWVERERGVKNIISLEEELKYYQGS